MKVLTLMLSFVGLHENDVRMAHFGEKSMARSRLGTRRNVDEKTRHEIDSFDESRS